MKLNDSSLHSLKQLNTSTCSKEEFLEYFNNGWRLYEIVMGSLKEEKDYYNPPNTLRRPLIFYLGHTACFFINKLVAAGVISEEERVNKHFEELFAVGVDEMSWDDMNEEHFDWPPIQDVWEYRNQVKQLILNIVEKTSWELPIVWEKHGLWALVMGCEHERIHLETSSVLIREMDIDRVKKPEGWVYASSNGIASSNEMIFVDPIAIYNNLNDLHLRHHQHHHDHQTSNAVLTPKIRLGKNTKIPSYGWDNEYGNEQLIFQQSFEVSKFKITNGEFLQFINAKGYEIREYWDEEGWNWRSWKNTTHPHFWVPLDASKYRFRLIYDIIDMPWDWPVELNYLEAKAFCKWKGSQYSLITEDQFNFLAQTNILLEYAQVHLQNNKLLPSSSSSSSPVITKDKSLLEVQDIILSGESEILQFDPAFQNNTKEKYNFDLIIGSSSPVDQFPANHLGLYDLFGNVWEWGESYFKPRKGFQVHPIYYDFSTPCFDDKHNMILGGSWISTGNETSIFARYAFRRHFFQHAGFRLVRNHISSSNSDDLPSSHLLTLRSDYFYSTLLNQQPLLLSFVKNTVHSYAQIAQKIAKFVQSSDRGLQIGLVGSRVGKFAFELSRYFDHVNAFDLHGFIDICNRMRKNKNVINFCDQSFEFSQLVDDDDDDDKQQSKRDIQFASVEFSNLSDNLEIQTNKLFDVLILFDITKEKISFIKLINQMHQYFQSTSSSSSSAGRRLFVVISSYDWMNSSSSPSPSSSSSSSSSTTTADEDNNNELKCIQVNQSVTPSSDSFKDGYQLLSEIMGSQFKLHQSLQFDAPFVAVQSQRSVSFSSKHVTFWS